MTPTHSLKYCGGTIVQNEHGIEVSYAEYMKRISPVTIQKGRKDDQPITEHEKSKARGLIGALQWPATQGLPMLAASMSIQAGELAGAKIKELTELNKTLRFGKAHADVNLKFLATSTSQSFGLDGLTIVCYADAAFCVRSDKTSQGGYVLMACDASVLKGKKVPASIVGWRSFKLPRVCRSSLAAECQACSTALEELMMAKLFLQLLKNPCSSLREARDQLHGEECAMVTDCKGLFDAVKRETVQQATDKRVAIEGLLIKDMLRDLNCQWRWVSSERQLADGLTKVGARVAFVERFRGAHIQLVADESYQASKKKTKADRERTVQETHGSTSRTARALIAMVIAEQLQVSEQTGLIVQGAEHASVATEYDMKFICALALALFLVFLTFIWFACPGICSRRTRSTEGPDLHELCLSLDTVISERDELRDFCKVLKDELAELKAQRHRDEQVMGRNACELDDLRETRKDLRLTVGSLKKRCEDFTMELQAARAAAVANVFICPRGRVWHKWKECPMIGQTEPLEYELCMRCAQTHLPPMSNVR